MQAVRDDLTLVSVAADTSSTFNITPITNLIASRLSVSGDPAKLAAEMQANPSLLSSAKVNAKVAEVVALLQPLLDAIGTTANPLTGIFAADGTGSDRVLDSLSIKITPDSATSANIEVALKQKTADGEQPDVVQFSSAAAPPSALPVITASKLVPNGGTLLIADLLQRITACFALPVADRVNTPDPALDASATDIKAAACKTIFDNNAPTTYLHNRKHVGSGSKTSFNGIFKTSGNGFVFDRGNYEFTRANGDIVVGYRGTDSAGNILNDTLVVRFSSDRKLRLIGNQYAYDGGVKAYQQLREFVNQPAATYYSTGYDFSIAADVPGTFEKVVVTTPKGGVLTLKEMPGSSNLVLQRPDLDRSGTSFLRIRSVYADNANIGNPSPADTNLFFASNPATEAEIVSYPHQSSWKFEYYLTGNSSTTPDARQYYKTRARAMAIAEFRTQAVANLTPSVISDLQTNSSATGVLALGVRVPTGPASLGWSVPAGALAPTQIKIFGKYFNGSKSFDDSTTVGSTSRTGNIYCASQGGSDTHCSIGNYVPDSTVNGLHLWARDPAGREFAHFYALDALPL